MVFLIDKRKMNLHKINEVLPLVDDKNSCLEHRYETILAPLPPKQIGKTKSSIKRMLEESSHEISKR